MSIGDRHDKSGVYLISIIETSPNVEKLFQDNNIQFTRTSPTEIIARASYEIASRAKLLARHCRILKI